MFRGPVAQLGERYIRIVEVASSILAGSTLFLYEKVRRGAAHEAASTNEFSSSMLP